MSDEKWPDQCPGCRCLFSGSVCRCGCPVVGRVTFSGMVLSLLQTVADPGVHPGCGGRIFPSKAVRFQQQKSRKQQKRNGQVRPGDCTVICDHCLRLWFPVQYFKIAFRDIDAYNSFFSEDGQCQPAMQPDPLYGCQFSQQLYIAQKIYFSEYRFLWTA